MTQLDEAGPRAFIWWVLLGLTVGGVLMAHAARQIAKAFPAEVRASAVDAVKQRPRIAAVTASIAAWTLVYALYSLAYPSGAAFLGSAPADTTESIAASETAEVADPIADNRELIPPSLGGELAVSPDAFATVTPEPTPPSTPTTTPPGDNAAPPSPPPPSPEPEPCPAEAVANALGPQAVEILCPGSSP